MQPELISKAYDALNLGILVVSHVGMVCHYNAAYARLRKVSPGEMVGRSVHELDRRGHVTMLLHSGAPLPEKRVIPERRRNRETLIPIREEGQLLGCVVIVTPASELPDTAPRPLRRRVKAGGDPVWPPQYTFENIIGNTPSMVRARELAARAAEGGSSVLLVGESGTGKELFARVVHGASSRRAFPFVPVDCSVSPPGQLEAELLGYAPGVVKGADQKGKPGKFELANRGTLFLDEVGEMPQELQTKLLRVLQEHRTIRIGGVTPIPVTFSVIAVTHRDPETLVAQGRLRRDLLYRLDVVRIEIPSLRERREDIPLLVEHFWERKRRELGETARLSTGALQLLKAYHWPGNVRELLNLAERLLVAASGSVIEVQDLPPYLTEGLTERDAVPAFDLDTVVAEAERRTLERALQQVHGNRNKAAKLVGLSRASFYRKLKIYGLTEPRTKKNISPISRRQGS
ncbi:MAG: sigma-54 interaction domain-containing protein [Candidatus Methylomirabilales bacterium]